MRNISAASLAKLAQATGTEPHNIIEIQWVEGGGRDAYGDRQPPGVKARIVDISDMDDVLTISGGGNSQSIDVTLDDIDGTIKAIIDTNDIHLRPVWVYQWFEGIQLSEKFLLFRGMISSPIVWSEGDRTVSFTIINQIEDKQIGFSPEEGDFDEIPDDLIGRPWPMCFGTPVDVPAVRITETAQGNTMEGIGIADYSIGAQVDLQALNAGSAKAQADWALFNVNMRQLNGLASEEDYAAALQQWGVTVSGIEAQLSQAQQPLLTSIEEQEAVNKDSLRILGGKKFPQGVTITLNINGGLFTGAFNGEIFHISRKQHPSSVGVNPIDPNAGISFTTNVQTADNNDDGDADSILSTTTGSGNASQAGFFYAEAGTRVFIEGNEPIDNVVSIVTGQVLAVRAYRGFEGVKRLMVVPQSYYSVFVRSYGTIQAVIVRLVKPLSSYVDEKWEDDIYVTFESDVGPNTTSILLYLIDTYTDFEIDANSFNIAGPQLENYPMDFAILDRPNIIQALDEIATQARCAIWLNDDKFFLRYLSPEPASNDTITEDDIDQQTLELTFTDTEELVTEYIAEWKDSLAAAEPNKIILRHNIKKYGTKTETTNYYCYRFAELVEKSATFWMIRKCNTWKRVRFQTFLNKLRLETFDVVTLDFNTPYVANTDVKALVESSVYDSSTKRLQFECWLPVRSGEMTVYDFAWPANISIEKIFPTIEEEFAGFAGGDGPGKDAVGTVPGGTVTGGISRPKRPNGKTQKRDYGTIKPSDTGDVKPTGNTPINTGPDDVNDGSDIKDPAFKNLDFDIENEVPFNINLRKTKIIDPQTKEDCVLATFFRRIKDSELQMRTDAKVTDGSKDAPFAYVFDEESNQYIANLAQLKDD